MTAPKTIQQEFESFLAESFPDQPKPGSLQYQQLQMAFFGGALVGTTVQSPMPYLMEAMDYLEQFKKRNRVHAQLPN